MQSATQLIVPHSFIPSLVHLVVDPPVYRSPSSCARKLKRLATANRPPNRRVASPHTYLPGTQQNTRGRRARDSVKVNSTQLPHNRRINQRTNQPSNPPTTTATQPTNQPIHQTSKQTNQHLFSSIKLNVSRDPPTPLPRQSASSRDSCS